MDGFPPSSSKWRPVSRCVHFCIRVAHCAGEHPHPRPLSQWERGWGEGVDGYVMSSISVKDLVKEYKGDVRAVDGVSFDVEEGELFGFLGPNGAGKSTTIKILTTLLRPTSGTAEVLGIDVRTRPAEVRRSIGYAAQEVGIDENATGRENLVLYGHFYRLDGKTIRRRVDELLELMDLTGDAHRLVATYSGGMRKRLDLATAIIHTPRVLILDEPTVGLDPQTRGHIGEHVRNLSRDFGITVFFTTHYMDEADALADRVAIIDHGSIIAVGTPLDLKREISGDVVSLTLAAGGTSMPDGKLEDAGALLRGQPFVRELQMMDSGLNVYVEKGETDLPRILRVLDGNGLMVQTISLSRPTLDDVFLKHTGRTIRDEEGQRTTWARMLRDRRRRG